MTELIACSFEGCNAYVCVRSHGYHGPGPLLHVQDPYALQSELDFTPGHAFTV